MLLMSLIVIIILLIMFIVLLKLFFSRICPFDLVLMMNRLCFSIFRMILALIEVSWFLLFPVRLFFIILSIGYIFHLIILQLLSELLWRVLLPIHLSDSSAIHTLLYTPHLLFPSVVRYTHRHCHFFHGLQRLSICLIILLWLLLAIVFLLVIFVSF